MAADATATNETADTTLTTSVTVSGAVESVLAMLSDITRMYARVLTLRQAEPGIGTYRIELVVPGKEGEPPLEEIGLKDQVEATGRIVKITDETIVIEVDEIKKVKLEKTFENKFVIEGILGSSIEGKYPWGKESKYVRQTVEGEGSEALEVDLVELEHRAAVKGKKGRRVTISGKLRSRKSFNPTEGHEHNMSLDIKLVAVA